MKSVVALLLGLISIALSADDGKEIKWDSNEDTSSASYNGLVVQVYNPTDGDPVVTLGTDLDNHENTYCLTLLRVFEATGYDLTQTVSRSSDYEEIDGSSVDLSDASCAVSETSSTTFTITCSDVRGANLYFSFIFIEDKNGDEGLEYTITLEGYSFVGDSDAQLVLAQSVKECSDLYPYSEDGDDEDDQEDDNDDEDDVAVDNDVDTRRRLLDDEDDDDDDDDNNSDSADEEDGISSDDSDEFDTGYARFVSAGQAYRQCDGAAQEEVSSQMIYDTEDEELHIVFNNFGDCTLFIDPYFALDSSKYSAASTMNVMIGMIMSLIGALLF